MKSKDISIIGLGKVGITLAANFATANMKVIGFDLSKKLISDQVYPFITSGVESEIDIDYEEDFKAAELYIKTNLI